MIEWVYKEVKCLEFLTDEPRRKKQPLCPGVDDPATAHGVMLINSKLHSVCGREGGREGRGGTCASDCQQRQFDASPAPGRWCLHTPLGGVSDSYPSSLTGIAM